ncbi:chemotaxis protein [Oxalobacteraceae bacterium IMCC9480]|nr:chemotaxis protein [Oxalobacteraceae bacterium IMCC9480]
MGIGHINQAITQLDESTQQNAALVEESTAAAESMQEHALNLVDAISVFQIHGEPSSMQVQQAHPFAKKVLPIIKTFALSTKTERQVAGT